MSYSANTFWNINQIFQLLPLSLQQTQRSSPQPQDHRCYLADYSFPTCETCLLPSWPTALTVVLLEMAFPPNLNIVVSFPQTPFLPSWFPSLVFFPSFIFDEIEVHLLSFYYPVPPTRVYLGNIPDSRRRVHFQHLEQHPTPGRRTRQTTTRWINEHHGTHLFPEKEHFPPGSVSSHVKRGHGIKDLQGSFSSVTK